MDNLKNSENKPFFSIITCTFNSEKYLKECIESIEKQTFKNYEHIFIDALSTDSTMRIIRSYQEKNPTRVKMYQYPPNGIANAMNIGIRKANGEVILHLHSDDYLYSNDILEQVKKKIKNNISIVVGDCLKKKDDGLFPIWSKNKLKKLFHHFLIKSYLFINNEIPHPSTYIKKSVFDKYGSFRENLIIVMDYEFWLRVFNQEKILFVNKFFSVYRIHPNTVSSNKEKTLEEKVKLLKSYRKKYFFEYLIAKILLKPLMEVTKFIKTFFSSTE